MKPDAFLEHLRADADRMAELAARDLDADGARRVPAGTSAR